MVGIFLEVNMSKSVGKIFGIKRPKVNQAQVAKQKKLADEEKAKLQSEQTSAEKESDRSRRKRASTLRAQRARSFGMSSLITNTGGQLGIRSSKLG